MGLLADGALPAWLPALLQAHLRRERHHKCIEAALRLLALAPASALGPSPPENLNPSPTLPATGAHAAQRHGPDAAGMAADGPAAAASPCGSPMLGSGDGNAVGGAGGWRGMLAQLQSTQHPHLRARSLLGLGTALAPLAAALRRHDDTAGRSAECPAEQRPSRDPGSCGADVTAEQERRGEGGEGGKAVEEKACATHCPAKQPATASCQVAPQNSRGLSAAQAVPGDAAAAVAALLGAARRHGAPAEPHEMREAAARALGASGLLLELPRLAPAPQPARGRAERASDGPAGGTTAPQQARRLDEGAGGSSAFDEQASGSLQGERPTEGAQETGVATAAHGGAECPNGAGGYGQAGGPGRGGVLGEAAVEAWALMLALLEDDEEQVAHGLADDFLCPWPQKQ